MSEEAAVEAVIKEWHRAISSKDGVALKGLWDREYDGLIFIVEENNQAFFDWPSIEDYYAAQTEGPDQIAWSIDNLKVGVLGEAAWGYLTFVAAGRIESMKHDFVWDGRTSYVLRKTDGEWKIIHYHESLSRDRSHDAWGWFF